MPQQIEQLGPDHELKDAVLVRLKRQQDRPQMKARKAKVQGGGREVAKIEFKSRSASTSHLESVREGSRRATEAQNETTTEQSLSLLLPDIIVES